MIMDSMQIMALLLQNKVASAEALAATPAHAELVDAPVDFGTLESPFPIAILEDFDLL